MWLCKRNPMHAPSLTTSTHITGHSFAQAKMKNRMSCKTWNILFFFFHKDSATTVNHSCKFVVIIAAQVLYDSQSDNFIFSGTLPLSINSLRRHLLSAYWSPGSDMEIKKRKMKSSLPSFKESLKGKIFVNWNLKTVKRRYGSTKEEAVKAVYCRLWSQWKPHARSETRVIVTFLELWPQTLWYLLLALSHLEATTRGQH